GSRRSGCGTVACGRRARQHATTPPPLSFPLAPLSPLRLDGATASLPAHCLLPVSSVLRRRTFRPISPAPSATRIRPPSISQPSPVTPPCAIVRPPSSTSARPPTFFTMYGIALSCCARPTPQPELSPEGLRAARPPASWKGKS